MLASVIARLARAGENEIAESGRYDGTRQNAEPHMRAERGIFFEGQDTDEKTHGEADTGQHRGTKQLHVGGVVGHARDAGRNGRARKHVDAERLADDEAERNAERNGCGESRRATVPQAKHLHWQRRRRAESRTTRRGRWHARAFRAGLRGPRRSRRQAGWTEP